ncbi:hypothetical protein N0V82_010523 [Gnomoniopsis sp. IMI 355080]|nr:hypothetical protein N0V82_010523 [Gnomoniopsis sp. IMI 355080]
MPDPEPIPRRSNFGRMLLDKGFSPNFTGSGADSLDTNEALRWAAQHGFSELVETLIDTFNADAESKGASGETAMHLAAVNLPEGAGKVLKNLARARPELVLAKDDEGFTALHLAALEGGLEEVELLRSLGADILSTNDQGCTPLHLAAEGGHCEIIRLLVNHWNAGIDCRMSHGISALDIACAHGHLGAVQLLVELGAAINSDGIGGSTLHVAARRNHPSIIRYFSGKGVEINIRDADGWTILHSAVAGNAASVVRMVLDPEYGFDVDSETNNGWTALMFATRLGFTDIAKILVDSQANINVRNNDGVDPLMLACSHNHVETIQYLFENGAAIEGKDQDGRSPLLVAARQGNLESVCHLLQLGADYTITDKNGWNVLHLASSAGQVATIREFLDLDIGLDTKTVYDETPLMLAVGHRHHDAALFLLDRGADIEAMRRDSWKPLHLAAHGGMTEIVQALLLAGANPADETDEGRNAQFIAEKQGHGELAKILRESKPVSIRSIQQSISQSVANLVADASKGNLTRVKKSLNNGVELDAEDANGQTALSAAAQNGHALVVALLISQGANVQVQGANGESPLWWASRNGYDNVVGQLLSAMRDKASVDTPDCDGQTPLSAAAQQGRAEVVGLLLEEGANPDTETVYGMSPYDFASAKGLTDITKLLLRNSNSPSDKPYPSLWVPPTPPPPETSAGSSSMQNAEALAFASYFGRVAEMVRLLKIGVDVDGKGYQGIKVMPPIIEATRNGQDVAVTTLLDWNAKTETTDVKGMTAFIHAVFQGHNSIVKTLRRAGCRLNFRDNFGGSTPLHHAARAGKETTVELLIQLGSKLETKTTDCGETPLCYAAFWGHTAVAMALLQHGANIEAANYYGRTPLLLAVDEGHHDTARALLERDAQHRPESRCNFSPLCQAAWNGAESLVQLLIHHDAEVDHLSDAKNTPIILASKQGHYMVVRMLIEAGAAVHHRNDDGRTAISYAKEKSHEPVVKLLSQAKTLRLKAKMALSRGQQESTFQRSKYQYRPLQKGHIRVLELQPGGKGDAISFELTELALDKLRSPQFEALSYEWKESRGTIPVQCNQYWTIDVTPNCKAALERLRLETDTRSLWVDAVCINQADTGERNEQVAMMTEIFRLATVVLMWVGEETELTRAAFDTFDALSALHGLLPKHEDESMNSMPIQTSEHMTKLANDVKKSRAAVRGVRELYLNSYFTRAWIFQEIVLSGTRGLVLCGSNHCPWEKFKCALVAYQAMEQVGSNPGFHYIVQAHSIFSREGGLNLEEAVKFIRLLDAKDPRDKIFAVIRLSVATQTAVKAPQIDYNMTTRDVFVGAVRYFIDDSRRLQLPEMWVWNLSCRYSTKTMKALPTWVPDLTYRLSHMDLLERPFSEPTPSFEDFIQGRPTTTTSVSLHIDGSALGKVALVSSIIREAEVYDIVKSIVQALAGLKRGFYDGFPGYRKDPEQDTNRHIIEQPYENIYGHAICETLFKIWGECREEDEEIFAYLAWRLSVDSETPEWSNPPPNYSPNATNAWCEPGTAVEGHLLSRCECNLEICKKMEDRLRYDRDIVLTEDGYIGMVSKGEAKKGMIIALLKGSYALSLLTPRENEGEAQWFEYVDSIFMLHTTDKMKTLEDLKADATVERFELR